MNRLALLPLVTTLVVGLQAQSNVVPGLDGRLTEINDLTYYGRRGSAYPNGEIGMAMLNEMCNPGTVTIPWQQAMAANHPKFGFLIVRLHNDRLEQINEWSFCKHAFVSTNYSGPCGSCINPGTGSVMGINCADTYGAGNNASRTWLGPPQEIDPWLGTWNPVGSYFDIGDPAQPGYPAPADGIRDLSQSIFDSVDNRVTVDEIDLTTAGASYYYALQLIHQGEALGNRSDNNAHRGFNPTWGGSTWSFPNNSAGMEYGSVLTRWPGADVQSNHNGNDDGRFFVAVKVTPIGSNLYHYEYAVHNVDNSRAGASLRIPIDATATASNFTFGDIDTDPANDWTAARVGNEIVFDAPANNPIEWNTIYNFGFDADFPPGTSTCDIYEARPGAGSLTVNVQTQVPGGTTIASFHKYGAGCPISEMIPVGTCISSNAAGGTLNNTTSAQDYVYRISSAGTKSVLGFSIWTKSTGGTLNVPAYLYASAGSLPAATPLATTTMTIQPTEGFCTATFATPVTVTGTYYIGWDSTGQNSYLSDLTAGGFNLAYTRTAPGATWSFVLVRPSWSVQCTDQPLFPTPVLATSALPVLGTTYTVSMTNGLASALGVLVSGASNTSANGVPLPAPLPGAPGCDLLTSPDTLVGVITAPSGDAATGITVPNTTTLTGVAIYHQWALLDPAANALGIVVSDAGAGTIGN